MSAEAVLVCNGTSPPKGIKSLPRLNTISASTKHNVGSKLIDAVSGIPYSPSANCHLISMLGRVELGLWSAYMNHVYH